MAVFGSLASKLQDTFNKLRNKGKLTESDINEAMREIRLALLEADVNFKVVKQFIASVKERALGAEVLESLTPGQQVVKIVNDELIALLGSTESKIQIASKPPTVIMLCGLQGAGKTTTVGKLGNYFKSQGRRPLLAACDLQRPPPSNSFRSSAKASVCRYSPKPWNPRRWKWHPKRWNTRRKTAMIF